MLRLNQKPTLSKPPYNPQYEGTNHRNKQHGGYWDEYRVVLVFNTNIPRQPSKPVEVKGCKVKQRSYYDQQKSY